MTCRFTPEQAISDGLAEVARAVVLGDMELGALLRRLVRDLGLRVAPVAVEREVTVAGARTLLSRASVNAALLRWHDGVPEPEVLDWLAGVALLDPPHAVAEMGRVETLHGAVGAFSHLTGSRVIAEWLEVQGQTHGLSRLLSEQLTPSQLRLEAVGL